MQLIAAHFDAYRSLLSKSLDLTQKCIGLVGINESGKTNVLRALSMMSDERSLSLNDAPKMVRKSTPAIRFDLALEKPEREKIKAKLEEWAARVDLDTANINVSKAYVTYHVGFDKDAGEELRYFDVNGVQVKRARFLKSDAATTSYFVALSNRRKASLSEVPIITAEIGALDNSVQERFEQLVLRSMHIDSLKNQLDELNQSNPNSEEDEEDEEEAEDGQDDVEMEEEATESMEDEVLTDPRHQAELDRENIQWAIEKHRLESELHESESEYKSQLEVVSCYYDRAKYLAGFEYDLKTRMERREALPKTIEEMQAKVNVLEAITSPTAENKSQLQAEKQRLKKAQHDLETIERAIPEIQSAIASLQEALEDKYTDDAEALSEQLGDALQEDLGSWLPKVVTWQYSPDYILESQTEFKTISKVSSLDSISRPLVNLFRIGLDVTSLEDLKERIEEIQTNGSERSRCQDDLNTNVQKYLTSVWPSYDQSIRISLEQERIRVQFVDPNRKGASYYSMEERSQGCQTFISFLLTIGAEASRGVISNTLLLLDEPETHLHPTGVRFMLTELVKAANNGNIVVFATHSVFMIDTENYDRHMIITKKDEQTQIMPSRKDRIGYFMQEEVLYQALDVDLAKVGAPRRHYNFVFEGDGDAKLFECYYNKALKDASRPFELSKSHFYHGGKCSSILQCFKRRPAQMGTHWIFVLDNDRPAQELVNYLTATYGEFIDTFIHIFQYDREDLDGKEIELEDLLPTEMIQAAATSAATSMKLKDAIAYGDGKKPFCECIKDLLAGVEGRDEIKAAMKESLNNQIGAMTESIKNKSDMEKSFPVYVKWVAGVVESLKQTAKPKTKGEKVARVVVKPL